MRDIQRGQVWRSLDRRTPGRLVTVLNEPSIYGNDYVQVQGPSRRSHIRRLNFLTRYEFVCKESA